MHFVFVFVFLIFSIWVESISSEVLTSFKGPFSQSVGLGTAQVVS
jgi:hypothetical protein